jgi:hypothetical protein
MYWAVESRNKIFSWQRRAFVGPFANNVRLIYAIYFLQSPERIALDTVRVKKPSLYMPSLRVFAPTGLSCIFGLFTRYACWNCWRIYGKFNRRAGRLLRAKWRLHAIFTIHWFVNYDANQHAFKGISSIREHLSSAHCQKCLYMCIFFVFEKIDFEVQKLIAKYISGKLNNFLYNSNDWLSDNLVQ